MGHWIGPKQFVAEMERREAAGESLPKTVDFSMHVEDEPEEAPSTQDLLRQAAGEASESPNVDLSGGGGADGGDDDEKPLEKHTKAELTEILLAHDAPPPAKAAHGELVALVRALP